MPWRESNIMDERMAMMVDWQRGGVTKAELARRYGVHRNTVSERIERYDAAGPDGLKDLSRAPHHHPNATPDEVVAAVVAVGSRTRPGARRRSGRI